MALFQPANIEVPVGTTVTWTNNGNIGHTVTFRNGMKDSGWINPGGGTFRYTLTSKGIFPYYCMYHPYMVGAVTVT
ncbi:MAG TPA: plastocyanin/azurin family copper-binding protein [Ktedonobacteraceae bacterium]|nr:plastocyanin/azurin family copper-binding protein [Ktedonobacteraceae bacterium]